MAQVQTHPQGLAIGTNGQVLTSNGTTATWAAGGGGGGLTQVTGTDADTTMAVGNNYVVDMSAWATSDRIYRLPTTAATGEQVGITIADGNATYKLDMRTTLGSNDTINGVDCDSADWSSLFQAGETVVFECVVANSEWIVVNDGRIACKARIHRDATSGALSIPTSAFTLFEFPEETYNNGLITDITTNYDIEVRRSGVYNLNSQITIDGVIPTTTTVGLAIFKNGRSTRIGTAYNVAGDGSGVYHTVYSHDNIELVAGDALSMEVVQTSGGARNTLSIDAAPNFFSLTETL